MQTWKVFLVLLALVSTALTRVAAQPPTPRPLATGVQGRPTSVTLAQVIARQEENYARIRTAQGQVAWTGELVTSNSVRSESRVIHFALEPERSIVLVLSREESARYAGRQGQIDWSRVISAAARDREALFRISQPAGASAPVVQAFPFRSDQHTTNPMLIFHPRILGDSTPSLPRLLEAAPRMAVPPRLSEVTYQGKSAVRIEFANPASAGESAYYIVDPARAYLPLEIGRISGGRLANLVRLTIGTTADGTFIPARRENITYDPAGNIRGRELWHYDYLSVNEPLSRKGASLAFFNLPESTRVVSDEKKR